MCINIGIETELTWKVRFRAADTVEQHGQHLWKLTWAGIRSLISSRTVDPRGTYNI